MNRPGFSLIEVLIASAISVMLAGLLFGAFFQISRSMRIVDEVVDVGFKAAILQHQLEKDIAGACIPLEFFEKKEKKKEQAIKEPEEKKEKPEKKSAEPQAEKKKGRSIEKIFWATQKDKMLNVLTCITNNPLVTYPYGKLGDIKPKIVRVVYRLQEMKEPGSPTFKLVRQESEQLDFKLFKPGAKKIRELTVADGIKELKAEYIAIFESEGNGEKKREVKKFNNWNVEDREKDETEQDKKEKKEGQGLIPNMVRFTLLLWDTEKIRDEEFVFSVAILPDLSPIKDKDDKSREPEPKKKEDADKKEGVKKEGQRKITFKQHGPFVTKPSIKVVAINDELVDIQIIPAEGANK